MQQGKMVKFPDYDLYGNYTNLDNVVAVNGMSRRKARVVKSSTRLEVSIATNAAAAVTALRRLLTPARSALHRGRRPSTRLGRSGTRSSGTKTTQTNIPDPAVNLSSPVIFTIGFDDKR